MSYFDRQQIRGFRRNRIEIAIVRPKAEAISLHSTSGF